MKAIFFTFVLFINSIFAACSAREDSSSMKPSEKPAEKPISVPPAKVEAKKPSAVEPDYIKVQHCLLGFKDAVGFRGNAPAKAAKRTREEAEKLALDLFARAQDGEDFDAMVKEHTDDSHPGIYGMSNTGKPQKANYYPRQGMVAAFGDTGFPLQVGEVGIAVYDTQKSPYGWHIVKRIE